MSESIPFLWYDSHHPNFSVCPSYTVPATSQNHSKNFEMHMILYYRDSWRIAELIKTATIRIDKDRVRFQPKYSLKLIWLFLMDLPFIWCLNMLFERTGWSCTLRMLFFKFKRDGIKSSLRVYFLDDVITQMSRFSCIA